MIMPAPNFVLDLDRNLPQTMHEQARDAIIAAIRSSRVGFRIGDKLINQELSRQNPIHRNTLAYRLTGRRETTDLDPVRRNDDAVLLRALLPLAERQARQAADQRPGPPSRR